MAKIGRVFTVLALTVLAFAGCSNVQTPAGYVGYVTQGAILGRARFYALQSGPTSSGLGWLLRVTNVSVTPYTYTEDFTGDSAVLSRDNLRVSFRVHLLWKVDAERVKDLVEHYTTLEQGRQTEMEMEQREAQKRVVQAEGIGKAMAIINERLTSQYLQHEAIEAQKAMVGSPNHSTVYLPVGPMGVPLVGTLEHGK